MSGEFKLANGSLMLSTEAPGGIYNSEQLKMIASLCEGESAVVKATEDQRIALFVPKDKAAEIAEQLQAIGLGLRNYQDGLHQPTTCIGEMCADHLQDAMGSAMDLSHKLGPINLKTPLKIGINGCASCCVPTHTLDISIIGDMNGYRISLGGKNSQIPEMASFMAEGVPADKLPDLVQKVVDIYAKHAQDEESLQHVMERCGSSEFIEALAPYSQDAAGDDPMDFLGGEPEEAPAADATSDEPAGLDALDLDALPDADDEMLETPVADDFDDVGLEVANHEDSISSEDIDPKEDFGSDENLADLEDLTDLEESPEGDGEALDPKELMNDHEANISEQVTEDEEEPVVLDAQQIDEVMSANEDEFDDEDFQAEEVSAEDEDAFEEKIMDSIEDQASFGEAEDPNSGERLEAMKLLESEEQVELPVDPMSATPVAPLRQPISSSTSGGWSFAGLSMTADGRVMLSFSSGAEVMLDASSLEGSKEYNLGGQRVILTPDANGVTVEVDGMSCYLPRSAAIAG